MTPPQITFRQKQQVWISFLNQPFDFIHLLHVAQRGGLARCLTYYTICQVSCILLGGEALLDLTYTCQSSSILPVVNHHTISFVQCLTCGSAWWPCHIINILYNLSSVLPYCSAGRPYLILNILVIRPVSWNVAQR